MFDAKMTCDVPEILVEDTFEDLGGGGARGRGGGSGYKLNF